MDYKPSFIDQLDVDYICHHGIKGMHWGVRRFQNADGSLTSAGKKRYSDGTSASRSRGGINKKKLAKAALHVGAHVALGYGAYKLTSAYQKGKTNKDNKSVSDILDDPNYGPKIVKKKQQVHDDPELKRYREAKRKSDNIQDRLDALDIELKAKEFREKQVAKWEQEKKDREKQKAKEAAERRKRDREAERQRQRDKEAYEKWKEEQLYWNTH